MVPRNPTFRETFRYTIQGLALAPVFIAAIRFPRALPFRFLNLPAVSFVGVVSYGIYLVQSPIILLLRRTLWPEWIVAGLSLALSVAVATLLYYGVERPCARLRRRLQRTISR
jgi:peptidoglycan/LPS O-acetylase OafA/YrhL